MSYNRKTEVSKVKAVNQFGLDKELAERRNANYPHEQEAEAVDWIKTLTGVSFANKEFGEVLKDGVVLCELMNACLPNRIKKIYRGAMPFQQRENVSQFLKVCREIGVKESDLFTTEALFELKDLASVVLGIHAFCRTLQQNKKLKYSGPIIGPKVQSKDNMKQQVIFKESNPNASVSLLNNGSSGTMEASKYIDPREQILRKQNNVSVSNDKEPTFLSQGSSKVMDKSAMKYSNSRDQYFQ